MGKFRKCGTHIRTGSSLWAVPKLARGALPPWIPSKSFTLASGAADACDEITRHPLDVSPSNPIHQLGAGYSI